jgi:hypothetical protein
MGATQTLTMNKELPNGEANMMDENLTTSVMDFKKRSKKEES